MSQLEMSTSWVIWSLLFVLAGTFGLGGVFLDKRSEVRETLLYKARYNEDTDEYLQLYEEWRQLSPAEQAEFPWGYGEYGGPEIRKKAQAQQSLRLHADISDLASGVKEPHVLAEILYGDNWPQKIVEYKKRQNMRESFALAGTVSVLAGLLIVAGHFSCRIAVGFLGGSKDDKVPCHRVVNKEGRLAPNFAFNGWKEQKFRLEAEGVEFGDEMYVDLEKHLWHRK